LPERAGFYERTVRRLLDDGIVDRDRRVLVVAGGELDREVLAGLGFTDVTVSNLGVEGDAVADAENLPYEDESFDLVLVSAALHHCASPHRALLEMYRVARRALLALEARDSALMRLAQRLGLVDEYELTAVAANDFRAGGVRNSAIPNYVYRWTEREVEKTIASWAPWARHRILFFHELEVPVSVLEMSRSPLRRLAARVAPPLLRLVERVAPGQANLFAFCVVKPELPRDLQPWLRIGADGPEPDVAWIERRIRSK
jgi:SAM-dependent methyltransferase